MAKRVVSGFSLLSFAWVGNSINGASVAGAVVQRPDTGSFSSRCGSGVSSYLAWCSHSHTFTRILTHSHAYSVELKVAFVDDLLSCCGLIFN